MTNFLLGLTVRTLISFFVVAAASVSYATEHATPDDTAKVLAGLPPSASSPLASLTGDPVWKEHSGNFDAAWKSLDARQLSKVRAWSSINLTQTKPVLYYMFSGPDFLYANTFFPDASTYVMSGLEPAGRIPDLTGLAPRALGFELAAIRTSLNTILSHSFFITSEMGRNLYRTHLTGTLPVLYVFLARSGKTIDDVTLVALDKDGGLHPEAELAGDKTATKGVKIGITAASGKKETLYYFKTDLSNKGVAGSGFLKFCAGFGPGDGLVKSASYLLHNSDFSSVREFLLKQSVSIVQDDTGIPVRYLDRSEWELHPFGQYLPPIPVFRRDYQPKLNDLFKTASPGRLEFVIGYRWRGQGSNLLLAVKNAPAGGSQDASRTDASLTH